ncbi:MAG: alkylphosphonate utilization protein [Patescibacteria group bacterium]|jgi:protein PhnA
MSEETAVTKDCNGNILNEGDSVQLNKDLKLGGSSTTYKIGTVFKNIRLTSDTEAIECKDGKTTIVLKTMFLKKRK